MEIDKAINILKDHNLWRRGSDKKKMATPEELGIAFVKVIAFAEETRASQLLQADVIKSVCECEARTFYEWEKDENKCSWCCKPLY
jgi:hypothetical protein